jgi:hypothetical protein
MMRPCWANAGAYDSYSDYLRAISEVVGPDVAADPLAVLTHSSFLEQGAWEGRRNVYLIVERALDGEDF